MLLSLLLLFLFAISKLPVSVIYLHRPYSVTICLDIETDRVRYACLRMETIVITSLFTGADRGGAGSSEGRRRIRLHQIRRPESQQDQRLCLLV